jgi:hypothetical protein
MKFIQDLSLLKSLGAVQISDGRMRRLMPWTLSYEKDRLIQNDLQVSTYLTNINVANTSEQNSLFVFIQTIFIRQAIWSSQGVQGVLTWLIFCNKYQNIKSQITLCPRQGQILRWATAYRHYFNQFLHFFSFCFSSLHVFWELCLTKAINIGTHNLGSISWEFNLRRYPREKENNFGGYKVTTFWVNVSTIAYLNMLWNSLVLYH